VRLFRKAHALAVPLLAAPAETFVVDDASACAAATVVVHGDRPDMKGAAATRALLHPKA
jgi:hypothetical protein